MILDVGVVGRIKMLGPFCKKKKKFLQPAEHCFASLPGPCPNII